MSVGKVPVRNTHSVFMESRITMELLSLERGDQEGSAGEK